MRDFTPSLPWLYEWLMTARALPPDILLIACGVSALVVVLLPIAWLVRARRYRKAFAALEDDLASARMALAAEVRWRTTAEGLGAQVKKPETVGQNTGSRHLPRITDRPSP